MDPYRELGLSPEAESEPELIRAAFKALAKKYHPDGILDPAKKAEAEEKMRRLNEAQRLILSGEYRPPRPATSEASSPPPRPAQPTRPHSAPRGESVHSRASQRRVPVGPVLGAAACLLLALFGPGQMQKRHLQRAQEFEQRGELQRSLEHVNEAIRTDSRNGEAFLLRARLWQKLGHPERAEVDLNNARSLVSAQQLQQTRALFSPSPTPTPAPPVGTKGGG